MNLRTTKPRPIQLRTRGRKHGPVVRLVSPHDLGEWIKPFVFLDRVDIEAADALSFGLHPHSGIATLTLLIDGGFEYEDSIGASGTMSRGAVEWMQAGGGVWHQGSATGQRIKGYQLWIALSPELENGPPFSQYLDSGRFGSAGPARVILGEWEGVRSPIASPSPINYLEVRLQAGDLWRYEPPARHDVAWVAVHEGRLRAGEPIAAGELVVFAQEESPIAFEAETDAAFVLGSAAKHPYELVTGYSSVHTSLQALRLGESGIRRVSESLRKDDSH